MQKIKNMKKILLLLLLICGFAQAQIVTIPDANFKNRLIALGIDTNSDGNIQTTEALAVNILVVTNSNISDLSGISSFANLTILYCDGNQINDLNLSGLNSLQTLYCGGNPLNSLNVSGLTNLVLLNCDINQLTTLDVSGLSNLQFLRCQNGQITSLNLTGAVALDEIYCDYNNLSVLNIPVLPNLRSLFLTNNNLSSLDLTNCVNLVSVGCDMNQISNLNVSGLTRLESLYVGGNQLAGFDLSGLSSLTDLECSYNQLTSLNLSGISSLMYLNCSHNQLTVLDLNDQVDLISFYVQNNNLNAFYIKNGRLITGIDPNFYDFSNNPNLTFICAEDYNLEAFTDGANMYGLTNVVVSSYCSFNPGGDYNTITGTVIFDADNNGCNASDLPQPFVKVKIASPITTGAGFTTANGIYTFYTQAGSFEVMPDIENPSFFNFSPVNATINFPDNNNNTAVQNFCITANGVHPDLEIVITPVIPARPGFNAVYKIVYKNKGNQILSQPYGINFFYNQNLMNFVSATQVPDSQNVGALNWNYSNLMPFESRSIEVTMHINSPVDTNPVNDGDVLQLTASILPMAGDETTQDNLFQFNQTVVNSYDPNDKRCLEGDVESPSKIGDYLHYTINFENIGTAEALNVVVKDVIDITKFDEKTLQILNSSHPVAARIKENVAEFIFQNINLAPADNGGGGGGHGNILLKIKTRDNLTVGDEATNKANIYFDYNAPIETDTARTVFQSLGVGEHFTDQIVTFYPNPTGGAVEIKSDAEIKSIQLFDVQGRILRSVTVNAMMEVLDLSAQASGVYFVKVTTDKGVKVERVLKK